MKRILILITTPLQVTAASSVFVSSSTKFKHHNNKIPPPLLCFLSFHSRLPTSSLHFSKRSPCPTPRSNFPLSLMQRRTKTAVYERWFLHHYRRTSSCHVRWLLPPIGIHPQTILYLAICHSSKVQFHRQATPLRWWHGHLRLREAVGSLPLLSLKCSANSSDRPRLRRCHSR